MSIIYTKDFTAINLNWGHNYVFIYVINIDGLNIDDISYSINILILME